MSREIELAARRNWSSNVAFPLGICSAAWAVSARNSMAHLYTSSFSKPSMNAVYQAHPTRPAVVHGRVAVAVAVHAHDNVNDDDHVNRLTEQHWGLAAV